MSCKQAFTHLREMLRTLKPSTAPCLISGIYKGLRTLLELRLGTTKLKRLPITIELRLPTLKRSSRPTRPMYINTLQVAE